MAPNSNTANPFVINKKITVSRDEIKQFVAAIERVTFVTDPLKRIYKIVRGILYCNEQGCWFQAGSGFGKSKAITYCCKALRAEFPLLPIYELNEHVLPANALRNFFIRMLDCSNSEFIYGETTTIRIRLAKRLATLANECPMKLVVLLLDEGQAFRNSDLLILKDLSNDMAKFNASLLVITFGESPQMKDRVYELLASKGKDEGVAQRFVGGRELNFPRYSSADDWLSLFKELDSAKIEHFSDMTVTDFFFQGIDISEFSMVKETAAFMEALKMQGDEVSLRKIFLAIRRAILSVAIKPPKKLISFPENTWTNAFTIGVCGGDDD